MAVAVREHVDTAPYLAESRRFTVEEYERLHECGIISEVEQVELLRGEIIEMNAIGMRHANTVSRCTDVLAPAIKPHRSWAGNPIQLPNQSLPQPDYVVLRAGNYAGIRPSARDIILVVEVADSSKHYDLTVKFPLYAAAGIPEAWMFDLNEDRIQRHSDPSPDGYRQVASVGRGESITSLVLPGVTIAVDEVLERPAT